MKKFFAVFCLTVFVLSMSITVFAADMPQKSYPAGPIQKAERGFGNALFGWTEIPKRIVDISKETNPIKGLVLGIMQGTGKAFARTASGLGDIVTFPIGSYDEPAVMPDMPKVEQ